MNIFLLRDDFERRKRTVQTENPHSQAPLKMILPALQQNLTSSKSLPRGDSSYRMPQYEVSKNLITTNGFFRGFVLPIWLSNSERRVLSRETLRRGKEELRILQQIIDAEKSDLFDVLEYVFNSDIKPITREARVAATQATILALLNDRQKEFIEFVLSKYIETGVEELDQEKLPLLLTNKYQTFEDAGSVLGDLTEVRELFIAFQKHLYAERVA